MTAELEALARRAEGVEGATGEPVAPGGEGDPETIPEPGADHAKLVAENAALLDMVLGIVKPALPFIRDIWTAETVQDIAERGAAVEEKYGVSLTDILGPWKEEIMLAVAIVPPSIATYHASKAYIAHMREQAKQNAQGGASAAPGGAPGASDGGGQ